MKFIFLILGSYLLGSIPFALIIAKAHGIDLRKIGSGNIGATNLSRALGKKWAYFCFALDVLKGLVPMLITKNFISDNADALSLSLWLSVGIAAVIGHVFPLYIGFKGGKGVATSFGVALGLWPYYTVCSIIAFLVWALFVLIWRYISLASIVAALIFPITLSAAIFIKPAWQFSNLWPLISAAVLIPIMVVLRHVENIKRIIAGTESKVFQKNSNLNQNPQQR